MSDELEQAFLEEPDINEHLKDVFSGVRFIKDGIKYDKNMNVVHGGKDEFK